MWIFQLVNNAIKKLVLFREKTEKVAEEEKLFKEKELEQLEKKIAEVKMRKKGFISTKSNICKVEKWRDEKLAEQADTPLSEMPKLTVSMINSKVTNLFLFFQNGK